MYRYDQYDKVIIQERVSQFRDQVQRRLEGKITENEFKPLRLQNGLYMQLHAYMLRVAIPYGLLSSEQLRKLAHIARVYDKGYAHFSTRQNVQYNWPALEDVPKILDELAEVEMHAVQTSGNCVRNTTSDPFAGVAADGHGDECFGARRHAQEGDHASTSSDPAASRGDGFHVPDDRDRAGEAQPALHLR